MSDAPAPSQQCRIQLLIDAPSDETGPYVRLLLTVAEPGAAGRKAGACGEDSNDAEAAVRQRLLGIETEAAGKIDAAADELAAAASKAATKQTNLCEEHLDKVRRLGGCRCEAAAG